MATPHRLYVGTIGEGLWHSSDGGATFTRDYGGLFVECHVRALAVHPRDPRTLYLGTELGLFRSTDAASNWSRVESPINGLQVWSIAISPRDPNLIVVGTCPSRLFRTEDGGKTWSEPAVKIVRECPRIMRTRVTTVVFDPAEPGTVWAGVEIDGLFRSTDAGVTWQPLGQGLSSRDIHGMAIVPGNGIPKSLLASTNNDLNLSTDGGETWQPQNIGKCLPWSYCRGMAQLPSRPEVVFLGNGDGPPGTVGLIARSTDGGTTWRAAEMPGRANSTIWNFGVHAANSNLVYASSVSGEVYRSTDGGAAFEKLPREFGEIRQIAWAPD
ncbi:MAG TPA: hypothetical protein VKE94_22125 [Gemmataceae bacterium]|nr:hypothetical protein [Gemmataceae bacterium]